MRKHSTAAHICAAAVVTMIAGGLVVPVASQPSIWHSWGPATCMPDGCFCEAIRPQLVRQPANAVSGVAFVGVGLFVLLSSFSLRPARTPAPSSLFTSRRVYPILFASAALLIGVGTVFYHASLTFHGQTADVLGMYLIAMFAVLYAASRVWRISPTRAAVIYVVCNAVLLAGLVLVPEARRYAFGALVVLALGLEVAARRTDKISPNARLFQLAVAVLALGSVIWTLDITRRLCAPASWLQGHAVWHVAGAVSLLLMYLYYRSATEENPNALPDAHPITHS